MIPRFQRLQLREGLLRGSIRFIFGRIFRLVIEKNSGSDIAWSVYLSDKELSEDEIKELSKTEQLAVNEGSDAIRESQWIYVLCRINKETDSLQGKESVPILINSFLPDEGCSVMYLSRL